MFASDWTNAMGIMKKKVREKKATAIRSFRTVMETYGIARFCQNTSRGSGAHSVNHRVGFRACCVCAQTAAPQRVLNDTKAAGMIAFGWLQVAIIAVLTSIWKTRNGVVFDKKKVVVDFEFKKSQELAFQWLSSRNSKFKLDLCNWMCNPSNNIHKMLINKKPNSLRDFEKTEKELMEDRIGSVLGGREKKVVVEENSAERN
ncbi:hypothetical protein LXL04_016669 [Taraxacum kok-saghyz]